MNQSFLEIHRETSAGWNIKIAAYCLMPNHYHRGALAEVGKTFGIGNYSTVSSAIERVKLRIKQDRNVRKYLEEIRNKLNKSQRQT